MLLYLSCAFTILLVLVNLTGLSLVGTRVIRDYGLARVVTVPALALALFFVEHFVGLGRLDFLWPLTTALSGWAIVTRRDELRANLGLEVAALLAFAWILAWRVAFPDIDGQSEKIGDLAMIVSYLSGDRLPPPDAWYPPYRFDIYYAFQHYAAALLGRVFGLSPGLTYSLAFCVVNTLTVTAAVRVVTFIAGSGWRSTLVVLAFVVGGTGATLPVRFMTSTPQLFSGMRFIGGYATPERADTALGQAIVNASRATSSSVMELPTETFGYLITLGDYHPPLSGFYLLTLALLCVLVTERRADPRPRRVAQAILAATPVLCLVSNGWMLPLQGALVAGWVGYRAVTRRPPDWRALALGVLVATTLIHPFMLGFGSTAVYQPMRPRIVALHQHAPIVLGAIVLYPIVVAALLPILGGERRREIAWTSGFWLTLLAISETFFIDDVYSGPYERFNTTLKWWPWIQAGTLLTIGAYGVKAPQRIVRYGTIAVLLVVSWFGVDLTRHIVRVPKPGFGRIEGSAWITRDPSQRAILEYLRAQPRGIVLQRPRTGAFTEAPAIVMFAGQQAFAGWLGHEKLWRGGRADIDHRSAQVASFYRGEMADSLQWLRLHRIDHVLWLEAEQEMPEDAFDRIDAQIRDGYRWQPFNAFGKGEVRVGVWSRIP